MDWLDTYSDPSVKAASVVTNLWIAAFAITSALFALLGAVVALQWPNPRILCYKTSYSDMPSNSLRSCCSLYSLNLGFTVFWLLVFAIMVIARDVVRIIICLCFWIVHVAVVVIFRLKFKRYGRPERPFNPSLDAGTGSSIANSSALGPGQAVGIPVYNIPMQTVVIGPRSNDSTTAAAGAAAPPGSQPPPYWYDANCIPPAQGGQGMPAAAGAAAGGVVAAGLTGPYPSQPAAYPPQPAAAGDGSALVVGQPVGGVPAAVPTIPPPPGTAAAAGGARSSLESNGPVGGAAGAAAGAAAAAGAGALGAAAGQQTR